MAMTEKQLQHIVAVLHSRRDALSPELRRTVARAHEAHIAMQENKAHDNGDRALDALTAEIGNAEVDRQLGELHALDDALQRIAEGSYGLCIECGDAIPDARLRAQPDAKRCIKCQHIYERTHAHPNFARL